MCKGLLVYKSGNQVEFDIPFGGIIPYVMAHMVWQKNVTLYIDGHLKYEAT